MSRPRREIPNPGDYLATEITDEPLLMVRGEDAEIRVLSNVCRHRGMRLRTAPGCESRLSCPTTLGRRLTDA